MKYKVPFVNYPKQYQNLKPEIDEAFQRIMNAGDLIYRSDMVEFEQAIATKVGKQYGIGMGSCTGAMYLALWALGVGRGDEVITVDHTYIATIDVIVHRGAIPVLIDVRDDFNMNPDLIEEVITPYTKAIMPVHLNGRSCAMDKIMSIADRHHLFVIEDNAQSFGASYKGKPCGSQGDISTYSFYPAKILGSYGEGGMACCDDERLARILYLLRDHGEKPSYLKTVAEKLSKNSVIAFYGHNTILDNMQCAFMNVKLRHFSEYVEQRRQIAKMYNEGLSKVGDLILPSPPSSGDYFDVYQNYVIRTQRRDELVGFLERNGVEVQVKWAIPNYRQKTLTNLHMFYLPKTDQIAREVLSLPCYPELEDGQVGYVIEKVKEFFK